MRKKYLTLTILITALSVPSIAMSEEQKSMSTQEMNAEEKTVLSVVETMTSNLQKGNIDGVMSTYVANPVIIFEPGVPMTDAEVSRQIFSQMIEANPQVTYSGHEVYVSGDTAIHLAPWNMTGVGPDGAEMKQGGLSVAVLRKQEDGSWKMVIDNPYGDRLLNN
ncbi:YybH family protein [Parasphingorhabdus sp.]|uniref:YybH family protein n=1 Tax=Parasphingorhabdus sp. TaxID=2709688 RepID=UPI003D2DAE15